MEDLKKQRTVLKSKLTIFANYMDEIQGKVDAGEALKNTDISNIQRRLGSIEPLLDRFETILTKMQIEPDENVAEELSEFENKYFDATAKADCFLNKGVENAIVIGDAVDKADSPGGSFIDLALKSNSLNQNSVKLPTIQLPKFTGQSENWLEFRDLFVSLIHENDNLDSTLKFHYLRASLEGDAAQIIKAIDFCSDNYSIAWDTLKERFNSTKVLVHNHVKSLFQLEQINKESSSKLRHLLDSVSKHMRSVKSLTSDEAFGETLIVYLITSKLDSVTMREWEENVGGENLPTFENLKTFLKSRADLLETLESKQTKYQHSDKVKTSKSFVATSNTSTCPVCKDSHAIWSCSNFQSLPVSERLEKVKGMKLCILCLKQGHFIGKCKSKYKCNKCNKRHNILLHDDSRNPPTTEMPETVASLSSGTSQVLLSTASVQILGLNGRWHTARVLLDSGSQSNFITTNLCKKLMLKATKIEMTVLGISHSTNKVHSKCDIELRAHYNNFSLKTSCLVIDKITGTLPNLQVNTSSIKIPKDLKLADPSFHKPGNIDILLGAEHFWELLCIGQTTLGSNMPMLQKSRFGWLISGPIPSRCLDRVQCNFTQIDVQMQLAKFWEIEQGPEPRSLSIEEKACEAHYIKNTKRDSDGRFIVSLPLKESIQHLGDSRDQAEKRFLALERKLQSNDLLRDRYHKFMLDYANLNHMSLAIPKPGEIEYYLPHHGVLKEESVSTKLRVVFDGSAQSTTGYSLNDIMMVGPSIQQDLFAILLRFRKGKYAMSADIEKMYRQVLVTPEQRQLQRILWRSDKGQPINVYNLNTVTYGTASASFLSIRSLYQIGLDVEVSNPEIAKIIKRDFYVDDLLTSVDTQEQAKYICKTLPRILATGCFKIRKWISNDPSVLVNIKEADKHPNLLEFGEHEHTKTLGLTWSSTSDHLLYSISESACQRITKRIMLSEIAQIFDPLGLLSPCTITAKIMIQDLWREKIGWDESLPSSIHDKWSKFRRQLPLLNSLNIERQAICSKYKRLEMHGFADASTSAYGTCIYIRSVDEHGKVFVNLLCAKTKVAPVKQTTIPRLELCGALALSRLATQVRKYLNVEFNSCTYWCDSTIVIGWLKTPPNLLKTFVCNRVAEIQESTQHGQWRHVSTKSNPADLLSRGITPIEMLNSSLWWHGPSWLQENCSLWPVSNFNCPVMPEFKGESTVLVSLINNAVIDFKRYSSLTRLEKTLAYCFRFKNNSLKPKCERRFGSLTIDEIKNSHICLLKIAQVESFSTELKQLQQGKTIVSNTQIQGLSPFIDANGLIRVGGRLKNSNFNFNKCHPILLSGKHELTKLIFAREHLRLLHAGPQSLLACIRERYWAIAGRNLAKKTVRQCLRCFRASPNHISPIMGNLPLDRIQPSPPFDTVGVDYAGPLIIKDRKGRGCKKVKCYVCLFVCFVTKAVHLELVVDLSTESFILALRRFVSRRSKPRQMYSDNGTYFVGAQSQLKELGKFLQNNQSRITDFMTNEGISWKFIPPRAPHFGGLWESGVRSCKHHLKRVAGKALLTYEEMYSLLVQIEAVLNSRPLTPLSSDPNDLNPLTPAHFLVGRSLVAVPDPDVLAVPESRLNQYQRIQQLHQHFWRRWNKEYVAVLQQRTKWRSQHGVLLEGAMVLIREDNLPPLSWKLGRILQVHPGNDSVNRVATIKVANGTIKRAFSKICPLPISDCDPQ